MKKTILISVLFFTVFLLSSCGKKDSVPETKPTGDAQIESIEFKCENMHCKSCEEHITEEVKKNNGIKEVTADAKSKTVKVLFNSGQTSAKDIEKSINAAGYDTQTSKSENKHDCEKE
ncbi:MAG: heavy-metal-associated domain-containing protein [Ignavibacteriae bacterium]|nr:heavy-metal-associated domain-containing protein [Ignavibacteriota bacterium]